MKIKLYRKRELSPYSPVQIKLVSPATWLHTWNFCLASTVKPGKIGVWSYQKVSPSDCLSDFVKCFWTVSHADREEKTVIVLPDGYFDILFSSIQGKPFKPSLMGLSTIAVEYRLPKRAITYAISFKPLAADYLLKTSIASLINKTRPLDANLWNFKLSDLDSFENFVQKATAILSAAAGNAMDPRKKMLFDLLYASQGGMPIEQIAETVCWTSRQINRYFNSAFGMPLKRYCTILRYRACFLPIKQGKLFPERDFADQAHFIREVKKFSGVTPKQLAQNKNDRFIQFSTLREQ